MTEQIATQEMLACSQCKRTFARSDLVQIAGSWVCGNCKGAFLSRVVAGGPGDGVSVRYAGFWIRLGARFIDGFIFLVPIAIVAAIVMPNLIPTAAAPGRVTVNRIFAFEATVIIASIVFALLYEVLMLRYWGATVGKMACGVKVVRPDGSGLGWGVSFGRYLMFNVVISMIPFVNWILLLTTAIMAGVDEEKRGLHDRVCGTRVVYKRSLVAA
ncbi:MAG TPA: RDD family protein [Candidatus Acidoferrales bacterium]|nr:RDD family protein [Candidatus Acidoferrales bacterium]